MRTLRLSNQKHAQFPENYEIAGDDEPIDKLIVKECKHFKLYITGQLWSNLKKIIIEDCKHMEISISIPQALNLEQIYIHDSNYLKLGDFRGDFPSLTNLKIEDCKYLKLQGPVSAQLGQVSWVFVDSPYLEVFNQGGSLFNLQELYFYGCKYLKVNLRQMVLPNLNKLTFYECKYMNFQNGIHTEVPVLQTLHIQNCGYGNFHNIDKLPHLDNLIINDSKYASIPPQMKKDRVAIVTDELPESSQEPLVYNVEIKPPLDEEMEGEVLLKKFCPYCGYQMSPRAKFCARCGALFD